MAAYHDSPDGNKTAALQLAKTFGQLMAPTERLHELAAGSCNQRHAQAASKAQRLLDKVCDLLVAAAAREAVRR